MKTKIITLMAMTLASSLCWSQSPTSGLIPKTPTFYVNTNYVNNGDGESEGVAIANNGNVIIGWEDDGAADITYIAGAWSIFDGNGNLITPPTVQTNRDTTLGELTTFQSITNTWLSFFRSDGTPTPAYLAWGPKIKANLFGNGVGMGAVASSLGVEVTELLTINLGSGTGEDFPAVQLLNNNGTPAVALPLSGASAANASAVGSIRIGDWDYLANGNIVIVGESRQADDRLMTGQTSGNVPVYRIVTPTGVEVKAYTNVSSSDLSASIWHGVGVTANGFAVRFDAGGTQVRLFDNAGNPTSANISMATVSGHPEAGGGGRGDGTGFHGNGKDAYVYVNDAGAAGPWVTVLNADGTLRWSRAVADAGEVIDSDRVDGAIAPDGRVIAVWDSALANASGISNRLVQARMFSATGQPLGGRFVVSEWENPSNPATTNTSQIPRVAWRGDTIAVAWQSRNAPTVLEDPFAPPFANVIAARLFSTVLLTKGDTFYVNTNYVNNGDGESEGVAIANNGNVIIGWEDDGAADITYIAGAWSIFDGNGNLITPPTVQTNRDTTLGELTTFQSITNTWLSFFRSDGTPTPAYLAWGPKIKANLFGNGVGMGAVASSLGVEVTELLTINLGSGTGEDFPAVQLLNNNGTPAVALPLSGASAANASAVGSIRIGDWDYLANGNIVIVGESRQADDRLMTGQTSGNVPVYRIVTPTGVEVKAYTNVSSSDLSASIWHGVGVTANGFAVRFDAGGTQVRLFDNAGNPTSANISMATVSGHPEAGGGGRGDGTGFHGNGKDAYVYVNDAGAAGPWVTVLNADGTLRWSRAVADAGEVIDSDRVDGAIAPDGRVIAVWDSALANASGISNRLVQARMFSATGQPLGGRFVVSEWENPSNPATTNTSQIPRVAWRGDTIAVAWQSRNAPTVLEDPFAPPFANVIAARLLTVETIPQLSISGSGGSVTLSWTGSGVLQSAPEVTGPFIDVGSVNPVTIPAVGARQFFRVRGL